MDLTISFVERISNDRNQRSVTFTSRYLRHDAPVMCTLCARLSLWLSVRRSWPERGRRPILIRSWKRSHRLIDFSDLDRPPPCNAKLKPRRHANELRSWKVTGRFGRQARNAFTQKKKGRSGNKIKEWGGTMGLTGHPIARGCPGIRARIVSETRPI